LTPSLISDATVGQDSLLGARAKDGRSSSEIGLSPDGCPKAHIAQANAALHGARSGDAQTADDSAFASGSDLCGDRASSLHQFAIAKKKSSD